MKKTFIFLLILVILFFNAITSFTQDNVLSQKVAQLSDKLAFATEGEVVGVSGNTVYLNLGQESGIIEGIPFEVVRLDKDRPLKMGDKIIGYPETPVGQIEITAVRKDMSLARITEQLGAIKEGDKAYQQMKKITRVAITEFTYGDEYNSLTRNVQDLLYTNLIQRGMTVVEREKMEEVMDELVKNFTGMIDTSTAAQLGKMLGVEAVIVGTVADMGNSVDLRARLLDVEKGAAITAATMAVTKDPTIVGLLSSGTRTTQYEKRESAAQKGSNDAIEVNAEGFNFKLVDCQRKGENIVFEVLITSEEDNWLGIYLTNGVAWGTTLRERTRIFDNIGNEYYSNKVQLGADLNTFVIGKTLVTGVPIKAVIFFDHFSSQAKLISLLEVRCYANSKHFSVQFRNIPLPQ